jgi:hypothetical protein
MNSTTWYRLTYTINKEEIFTAVYGTEATDFAGVMEAALSQLEDDLTPQEFLAIKAINVLLLEEEPNNVVQ